MKKNQTFVDLLLGRTARRLVIAAAVALPAMIGDANAASLNYPKDMVGRWCMLPIEEGHENLQEFRRGKCDNDYFIILKSNGDYVFSGPHEYHCKAKPETYFKGWTEYVCVDRAFRRTQKLTQKWMTDSIRKRTLSLITQLDDDETVRRK